MEFYFLHSEKFLNNNYSELLFQSRYTPQRTVSKICNYKKNKIPKEVKYFELSLPGTATRYFSNNPLNNPANTCHSLIG